jgi:hypothetical protein
MGEKEESGMERKAKVRVEGETDQKTVRKREAHG